MPTRPGTRLLSNMAPTVARHDDGSTLAIGSPGADRITTAIAQVLAGYLSGLSLHEAVNRPRVHVHRAGRPDEIVRRETDLTMYYGGVGATLVDGNGRLVAAADPRREGAVRLVEGPATGVTRGIRPRSTSSAEENAVKPRHDPRFRSFLLREVAIQRIAPHRSAVGRGDDTG